MFHSREHILILKPCHLSLGGWKESEEFFWFSHFLVVFMMPLPLRRPCRAATGACRSRRPARGWPPPSARGWGSAASSTPSKSARSPSTGWWATWAPRRARCKRPALQRCGRSLAWGCAGEKIVGSIKKIYIYSGVNTLQGGWGLCRSRAHNIPQFLINHVLVSCCQCLLSYHVK